MKRLYVITWIAIASLLSGAVIKESKQGESIDFYTNPSGTTLKSLSLGADGALDFTLNNQSLDWTAGYGGLTATSGLRFQLDSDNDSIGETFGIYKDSATLGGGTELFHVDETGEGYFLGNVGIGTDSPDNTLHVHSGSAGTVTAQGVTDDLVIENSDSAGMSVLIPDDKYGYITFGNPSDDYAAGMQWNYASKVLSVGTYTTGGSLNFITDNTSPKMTIDSSGNVGIGDATPENKLTIVDDDDTAAVKIRTATADGRISYQVGNDVANWFFGIDGDASDSFFIGTVVGGGSDVLNITTAGNVGIGGSPGSSRLHLEGASTSSNFEAIRFKSLSANYGSEIIFEADSVGDVAKIAGSRNALDGRIRFYTTDTSGVMNLRFYLDGLGNALLGGLTSSLPVGGVLQIDTPASGGNAISINTTNASYKPTIYFRDGAGAGGVNGVLAASDGFEFKTNNATVTAMTIDSSGNVDIASENLNFGTAAKGIIFNSGDTLAYYDEGTWTPTMSGATLENTVAVYTRIGDFVRFHIVFRVTSVTTGTNDACLSLPTNAEYGGAYVTYQNANNNTIIPPYTWNIQDASNTLCLATSGGSLVTITTAFGTGSGAQYHLTGSYGVD